MGKNALKAPTAMVNGTWKDGAVTTDPADDAKICETVALDAGDYIVSVYCRATAAATIEFAHRNAADDGDNKSLNIPIAADTPVHFIVPVKLTVAANEKFHARMSGALTGNIEAHIFYAKLLDS